MHLDKTNRNIFNSLYTSGPKSYLLEARIKQIKKKKKKNRKLDCFFHNSLLFDCTNFNFIVSLCSRCVFVLFIIQCVCVRVGVLLNWERFRKRKLWIWFIKMLEKYKQCPIEWEEKWRNVEDFIVSYHCTKVTFSSKRFYA